jgi:hypothetical protein
MQRLLLSILIVCGISSAAQAQQTWGPYGRPAPRPYVTSTYASDPIWYVGVGGFGTHILSQSGGPEVLRDGGGLSIWAGVHATRALSLELGWMGSLHNPVPLGAWYGADTDYLVLSAFTADAKIHLGDRHAVDPYLEGGLGLYMLGSNHFGVDSVGTGFQAGGGIDFWLGQAVSLGVRARYHGIAMGPPNSQTNDTFISALTVEGSLTFHF